MPGGRYAALPSDPRAGEEDIDELEAAFEASDDEDEEFHDANSESRPLNPEDTSTPSLAHSGEDVGGENPYRGGSNTRPLHSRSHSIVVPTTNSSNGVGTYDFENVNDYDYAYRPPPGEPPRRDRALLNNNWGNSNGVIPDFSNVTLPAQRARRRGWEWMQSVLPERFRSSTSTGRGRAVGGGLENDGVFANVMAKPTTTAQVPDGGECRKPSTVELFVTFLEDPSIYVMPEDAQKDAPPSYATAQADAVPPYWETTVHAPSSLSPSNMVGSRFHLVLMNTQCLQSYRNPANSPSTVLRPAHSFPSSGTCSSPSPFNSSASSSHTSCTPHTPQNSVRVLDLVSLLYNMGLPCGTGMTMGHHRGRLHRGPTYRISLQQQRRRNGLQHTRMQRWRLAGAISLTTPAPALALDP
jgi:hypothetical protein